MIDGSGGRPGLEAAAVHLTRQECDVLTASARGAAIGEAAGELALPAGEVRAALASAIRKLGARSKLEAVILALRRGLIDP